jgi:hypothetical protein
MHSSNDLVSGYADQAIIEASECVTANNKEIMKQATILLRLIKLLDTYGGSQSNYGDLVEGIARKLETHLDIWKLYLRKDEEELAASSLELGKAMDDREILQVKRNVGEIGDEEYRLKMAALDWSVEHLKVKKSQIESSVKAMSTLHNQLEPEYVEEINLFAQSDYQNIRGLDLGIGLTEMIIKDFTKLADIVN